VSARIGTAEVRAVMHLANATSSLQRAHGLVMTARMDLAPVDGDEAKALWDDLEALQVRIEGFALRLKGLALSNVQLGRSHSGIGCEACILAEHVGAPESHGDRRNLRGGL
jgi:hypothetical protein